MNETEEKLYAQIGLLSTTFATIEHQVQEILECYITSGDRHNMLVGQLLDREGMQKKLQNLEKAVLFEMNNKVPVRAFIKSVKEHSEKRNHFIHGKWQMVPALGKYTACVFHINVKKVYPPIKDPDKDNPGWQKGYEHYYTLAELESTNKRMKEINLMGEEILKEIDRGGFEFF